MRPSQSVLAEERISPALICALRKRRTATWAISAKPGAGRPRLHDPAAHRRGRRPANAAAVRCAAGRPACRTHHRPGAAGPPAIGAPCAVRCRSSGRRSEEGGGVRRLARSAMVGSVTEPVLQFRNLRTRSSTRGPPASAALDTLMMLNVRSAPALSVAWCTACNSGQIFSGGPSTTVPKP